MTFACPPLLRFALHAALALAVLLQASMALAMRAPPAIPETAPNEAVAAMPPCHAMAAALADANGPAPADCCGDTALGESCRWACAQALGISPLLVLPPTRPLSGRPDAAPILPALRWTAQSPLRPPIG